MYFLGGEGTKRNYFSPFEKRKNRPKCAGIYKNEKSTISGIISHKWTQFFSPITHLNMLTKSEISIPNFDTLKDHAENFTNQKMNATSQTSGWPMGHISSFAYFSKYLYFLKQNAIYPTKSWILDSPNLNFLISWTPKFKLDIFLPHTSLQLEQGQKDLYKTQIWPLSSLRNWCSLGKFPCCLQVTCFSCPHFGHSISSMSWNLLQSPKHLVEIFTNQTRNKRSSAKATEP